MPEIRHIAPTIAGFTSRKLNLSYPPVGAERSHKPKTV
ncbi:hypothetical protein SAMN05216176_11493 [Nitratireductor indicus]|nr:hypothetical protein SAMN05216176_11493 [Nitratireductor indicus]